MKIDVTLQDSGNGEWFAPGDEVRGLIHISAREADTISVASVLLRGNLQLSFWPFVGDPARRHFPEGGALSITKELFKVNKVIVPDSTSKASSGLIKGQYVIPFSIRFPSHESQLDLPPTVNIALAGIKMRVDYSVRLEITRPGVFRHKLTKEKAVNLRVADSAYGISQSSTGTSVRGMLAAERLDSHEQTPYQEPFLPRYSPSIQVELTLPTPPILYTGQPLAMDLTASFPEDLLERLGSVRLRSLYIGLKALTIMRIGSVRRATTSYVKICSTQGNRRINIPVREGLYRFDPRMWQGQLVPPVTPTFQSAHMSRRYILEVTVGFSCEALEKVERVTLPIDIAVAPFSGLNNQPPPYSTTDLCEYEVQRMM